MSRFSILLSIIIVIVSTTTEILDGAPRLHDATNIRRRRNDIGFSLHGDTDYSMHASHPSELGGGHQAVFVDNHGHIEDALEKDIIHQQHHHHTDSLDRPIDGLPIQFQTDGHELAEHLHSTDREG